MSDRQSSFPRIDFSLHQQAVIIRRAVDRLGYVDTAAEKLVKVVAVGTSGLYQTVAVGVELGALVVELARVVAGVYGFHCVHVVWVKADVVDIGGVPERVPIKQSSSFLSLLKRTRSSVCMRSSSFAFIQSFSMP